MNEFTFDLQRFDDFDNATDNALVTGTANADSIYNTGENVTINGNSGADEITNEGVSTKIFGGDGNDTINNVGDYVTIDGGNNDDSIFNTASYTSIVGGDGADAISNINSANTSINGGDGKDTIKNTGYSAYIYGGSFDGNDTDDDDVIDNTGGADVYYNSSQANSAVSIYGGVGADSIKNDGNNVLVEGGDGADTIVNESYLVTITTDGALYDHYEGGQGTTLNGGDGNDFISNDSEKVTIEGGAGNDTVSLGSNSANVIVQYNEGDGNDSITGFTTSDTLVIGDGTGTYSAQTVSGNVIVTAGEGSITLNDAASLSALNINGELSGDSSTDQTITGATWTGTDADEEHGTTDYDIATQKTTLYSALYGMGGNDKLTNYPAFANVTIDGGAGDDQIYNRGAYGSLIGGEGNDYIDNSGVDNAKANNPTIDGGAGADVISNRGDNALITAGDDADSVYSSGEKATITGGAGNDTLNNYGNNSSIEGGEGDDNLTASGSNVTVHGGAGNDTLQFSGGSESIAANGIVEDTIGNNYFHSKYITTSTITGGDGNDTLYSAHIEDVTINLGAGANTLTSNYDKNTTITAGEGNDNVTLYDASSVNADLGDGANRILVSNVNDSTASGYTITSGAGADSVEIYRGSQANVSLGGGNDSITNRGANSTINGGDGNDWIYNGGGRDYDVNSTLSANNFIEGGAGNDSIENLGDSVTIDGGEGADYIYNQGGDAASLVGGAGNDTIYNVGNINQEVSDKSTIDAGEGDDYIYNTGTNVLINYTAGDGNDTIAGFDSTTTLSIGGGSYNSVVSGDDVIVTVGDGKITLGNAASLETLNIVGGEAVENWATVTTGTISTAIDKSATVASGTTGDDTIKTEQISGDTTARLIEGNGGNDSILNFVSKVTISGGADKDSVVSSADNVVIQTGGGNDYIQGATKGNVNITIDAGDGDDEIDTYGTNASINGGAGNDSIKISADSEKVTVIAGEGSDTVVNTATDSFIDGGAGADSIHNDSGNVTIDAGADDDVITSYGDKVSISGGAGADKIIVTNSYDGVGTISGGIGDDTVSIGSGNFLLEYTSGDGADVINGFKANDTLYIDGKYSTATIGTDLLVTVGSGILTLQGAATLESVNVLNEDDISAASFVTNLQQKTEYGYPVIAGLFFHPTEYHGFETLPSSYYASSETLTINSSDSLELTGYHYTPENPNDKWVILVHGYGHNHKHMNGFAMQYLTNNYHVLEIDQRAAGDSEGEWLTMGAAEGNDVALWTQKIAEINSKAKITLHGVSMGAATAMLAAANSGLTNVTSLVEDCGYTSVLKLVDIVKSGYPALGDPEYVSLVSDTAGRLTGHKLTEAAPIDSIGSVTIPSMFITGTSDAVVSPSMLETLYAASGAEVKEIFTVEGATHGVSALTDSIGYGNAVFRFNAEAAGEGWITTNVTDNISLRGTKYDDTITTSGANVTINTGLGDDTINNSGNILLQYNTGDGNDVINGITANDTINIGDGTGTYSTTFEGNNLLVNVGDEFITLTDAAAINPIINGTYNGAAAGIHNTLDNTLISGTPADDTIANSGSNVTIQALGGDDLITHNDNNKTFIDAGDGDDFILNSLYYEIVTLDGATVGTLQNYYSDTSIVAGAGNDTVMAVGGNNVSISAGEGNDYIAAFHSYYQTIDGGAGDDFIEISEGHYENIFGGDGNDSIIGSILFETVQGDWAMGGYAYIDGGAGADYVSVGYSNNATINGGDGEDVIITYGPNSQIYGGVGNDSIALISNGEETLNSKGTTITGGVGDDTITGDGSGVIFNYTSGDGDDVLIGVTDSDTLVIDGDTYRTSISGNDLIVSVVSSQNTITLKNAANVDVNIDGEWFTGKIDKEGTEIENPVATILYDGQTYYYESVARASEDADSDSTVTVIANSTETATISTTKNLAIQFAESGLGVYNVLSGNFLSYGTIDNANFSIATGRILSNNGVNYLQVANGSTATLDNYEVTGTSNGYTFSLQNNPFTFNGVSYYGEGTATFDTSAKVTLTSGAIVNDSSLATSDAGIVLAAGEYTLNGNAFTTTATHTVYLDSDGAHFNVSSDAVTYNTFTFNGNGTASIANDLPTLSAGVEVNRPDRAMVVLTEKGQNTIDGRGFQMIKDLSDGITVGAVDNGIGAAHIIPYESFPEDAGKLFAEEALIYGDDSYTVRLNEDGIKSIYGISAGSTVRGKAYFEGEVDPEGSVLQMAVDGSGSYTFGDKTYTINGDIDSVNVVGVTSRFYNDDSGLLRNVYYLNGTLSGDFSSAVTINQSSMPLQIAGDTNVDIYATDSAKASDDANKSTISSSGNVSVISGVGSGASIVSAGGATKVSTNEEGEFLFRSSEDNLQGQQAFTVSGDSSVDFILRNFTDANGNPTMQVEGINNFENGLYTITKETEYHAINVGESITASDELVMQFSDKATFVIADSQIVSVSGIDTLINRLKGDVTVHATHAVTVNELDANVVGDTDFDVIVSDSKTVEIANISAGATVKANNVNVKTDNNGDFTFATDTYKIEDTNNSVTFLTGRNGVVNNIADFAGTMQSSAQNVTVNGTAFTTSNTDASIVSAGTGISAINGLASGDTVGGALDTTTVLMAAASDTLKSILTVNEISYTLAANSESVSITGNVIDGLETGGTLEISHAGLYIVNDTPLNVNVGDIIIGTAENSAYIYDSKNVPLDIDTMSDDEIAAQAGISTTYSNVETNTMQANALVEQGGSALDGSMALALDNSNSNVGQTADFSANTGRKRVTLEGGEQGVKFNDEGGNVAVISNDATGEKNISLGGGGDLAIIESTETPVNITAGAGPDSIVTAGQNVSVTLGDGATKIIPNAGNVSLENYNPATGAGIQANDYADLSRAILNGYIQFGNGVVSLGSSAAVSFASGDDSAYSVNLFNNKGSKQKVGFTNSSGGELDTSGERENMLLIGNANGDKGASTFTAGSGDDVAFGGTGDTFDLGAGNNSVYLDEDRENSGGATINQTATSGNTEVNGFKFGFGDSNDRININLSANVSYKNGQLTFNIGGAVLVVNGSNSSADLAESADLIEDENFVDGTTLTLDEITPITYEQGDYQLSTFGTKDSLKGGVEITFAQG